MKKSVTYSPENTVSTICRSFISLCRHEVPELPAEHEEISCVLLGALRHLLSSVPQFVERVVDVPN